VVEEGEVEAEKCEDIDVHFGVGTVGDVDLDFLVVLEQVDFSSRSPKSSSDSCIGGIFFLRRAFLPRSLSTVNPRRSNVAT
jgi:hypothetical protein